MIKIIAISPGDGWAVVQMEKNLRLLRPPYSDDCCPLIQDADVIRLLSEPGFDAATEEIAMPDLPSVTAYLKNITVKTASEEQLAQAGKAGRQLLMSAPPDRIRHSLERIKNELLPDKQFGPALNVLVILIQSDAANSDAQLRREISELLEFCNTRMQQVVKEKTKSQFSCLENPITASYEKMAARIAYGLQVLQPI
ncbi:MAG: hypothetical protein HQL76_08270 [Magnetococcales bacterium]|nr:hypothetical protein [Magnetococcales bacterium]